MRNAIRQKDPQSGATPEGEGRRHTTISDMEIEPCYRPASLEEWSYESKLGDPGEFPYTRGAYPNMYRGKLWTMRQFAGFGTAEDTNERFRFLLAQGQTGLSTAFDMPTLMGYDADHPRALGEVGREGAAVTSLADMEALFAGIPLDRVTTSMTVNCTASVLLAMYFAVAERQGVSLEKLGGTIQNDMLKEFIAQKEWISPPEPSVRVIVDMIAFCARHAPRWHAVSISGYHIREAGSTAVQELAFTLADGVAYVQAAIDRGLAVDDFAPRLSFFFNVHSDFLEEIAKFRAARRMWAKIMRERFGAENPRSWTLRTHAQTAGCSLTAQQPLNNVARVAIQALAAVLGGANSLHTNSMDETLALPSEPAVLAALRTQQIVAEETGVINTVDPLGGSYAIEALTDRLEREALRLHREDRPHGRDGGGDRAGLPADGDRRGVVPLPAPARARREGNGRRQQTPGRRRVPDGDPARQPRRRAPAGRTRAGAKGGARPQRGPRPPRGGARGGCQREQPHAADDRRREGGVHDW